MPQPLLAAAREGYSAGLCLLPVAEDGSKRPALSTWAEYKTRRPTVDEMRGWDFAQRHGLGVVAGHVSAGIDAWDFDEPDTFTVFITAADTIGLGELVSRIRAGYEDVTPRQGRRWLVHYPVDVIWKDVTLAARPLADGKLKTLIELPTFAILAPSDGPIHPSGRPYRRVSGGPSTIARYSIDERTALIRLAQTLDERIRAAAHEPPARPSGRTTRPGDDYNVRATWPEVIGSYFHSPRTRPCGETYWWRPDKSPGESHAATTNFAGSDLLFVFSSSTPFEADRSYTKFAAYAVLRHSGDYSAAAHALAVMGYGDPRPTPSVSLATVKPIVERPGWPSPLSEQAYYGLFGAIVRAIESETESDPVSVLLQLLVLFGNVIGRTAHFVVEASTHYLNEFLLLAGPSAKARKGTSYGYAERVLRSLDPTWVHVSGLSSGEGLIWAIRDPIVKHVKGQETTEDPGISDKRLMVFESELASTLRVMERPGNILADVMKNGWDGRDLVVLTKTSPARATAPHVSLVSHITIDELRRYLTRSEMSNGWGNRFLLACVRRARSLPMGGRHIDLTKFRSELDMVVSFARAVETMGFDAEAERRWREIYDELSADRPGLLGSMTARAEAHTRRLACLFALSDLSNTVCLPHLEAALGIWRYVFDSVAHVFGDRLGDPIADAILSALRAAPDGLTRTAIHDLFRRHQTTDAISRGLELLIAARLVTKTVEATDGRPVERWLTWRADAKEAN